ncbi:tRNA (adenine-N(1)-)-methyltransferase catalytic subunit trm61 [Pestalotiopsis sp. IQ-011]
MFGFGDAKESRDEIYDGEPHQSKVSHELVAGGAAFEAMKLFEDRQRANGEPIKHAFAKEALAGIAGAEVDKLFETKGLDFLDREEAKHKAKKQAEHLYDEHYGQYDEYNPNEQGRHPTLDY